jgi:Domain of unknown function (DUF4338)/Transposase Tn5 dimerisation domain/Transposase DNA-binding
MDRQHQIKRTLSEPTSIEVVRGLLDGLEQPTRASLVKAVCTHFGFLDARGRPQEASCFKALRDLEAAGHLVLPERLNTGNRDGARPKRKATPLAAPTEVPAKVGKVRGLQLVVVETDEQRQIWKQMMQAEHPQGAGALVGAQLRYLIGSEHGWLGGFGFAASALHLADRDRWIGWDDATRREQLHRVVGMSRFLIRPSVNCANLASHVLGMVLRRLPGDFAQAYGYCPYLVESFVDSEAHAGISYQAANWEKVGQTRGRGRQDATHRTKKTPKAIYVYPLVEDFRGCLGVVLPPPPPPIGVEDGLSGPEWAQNEFGGAQIGHQVLSERLVTSARIWATKPGEAFCAAAEGDQAAIKGHYRMIERQDDRPDVSKMTMPAILAPHRDRTLQRMRAQQRVLCIQDGTDLNYSSLAQCEGLGVIGTNQTGAKSPGLHLHSTFVVDTDGLPLGILAAQCTAPQPKSDTGEPAARVPIEDKKTYAWIVALRECIALAGQLPHTRLTCVMDREADFFELFDAQRATNAVDLLVRAKHDRCTTGEANLFALVRQSGVQTELSLLVPRQSERPKKSKQAARPKIAQRKATVALRYQKVELYPPAGHRAKRPLTLWVIHARETTTPDDAEPLEWFLLTTIAIKDPEQAAECLRWYCLRWRIEDWHRVLKSGCQIEELQHETADRLRRAIAIKLVIAWRIMLMTLLGRSCPDLPAEVLFSDIEIEVLRAFAKKKRFKGRYNPTRLGDAVRLVAHLGGYIGRAKDPPPGHQVMWRGYADLQLLCEGYELRSG